MKRRTFTKVALTLSVFLLCVWGVLGATTSLAWFTDTTPVEKNTFEIGELDLVVSHKVDENTYEVVDKDTAVFSEDALYEPGYTQVVYLRIENHGNVDFDFRLSVTVDETTDGVNELGEVIHLPYYLKFGAVFGDSEAELDRKLAQATAKLPLEGYSETGTLDAMPDGEISVKYVALIVYMPENVNNAANYREDQIPTATLGITVFATQKGTLS